MKEGIIDYPDRYPQDHFQLRKVLVDELVNNLDKYNLRLNNHERKQIRMLYNPGQLPCPEILLAAAHLFNLDIHVHHGIASPVIYRNSIQSSQTIVHLQCISMIHYNPLYEGKTYQPETQANDKYINFISGVTPENDEEFDEQTNDDNEEGNIDHTHVFQLLNCQLNCKHDLKSLTKSIIEHNNCNYCCILDTGAQISLVGKSVIESSSETNERLEIKESQDILVGLGSYQSKVEGVVMLKTKILGLETKIDSPFAIVDDKSIPCCFLLGSNFIKDNDIHINFANEEIGVMCNNEIITQKMSESSNTQNIMISSENETVTFFEFLGIFSMHSSEEEQVSENIDNNSNDPQESQESLVLEKQLSNDESDNHNETHDELIIPTSTLDVEDKIRDSNNKVVDEDEENATEDDDDQEYVTKFAISNEELKLMQDRNYAVRNLKNNIRKQIPTRQWKHKSLNQFKRSSSKLSVSDGLLINTQNKKSLVVITFPFLVEVIHKVHTQLSHVGRHKLLDIIQEHFYHPAMNKVARDYCSSCHHCQLFKVNTQPISPPILKIKTAKPFELFALDLLQFPKSSKGNVAALVAVDHFSKWLVAIPLRNKQANTVTNALQHQILPHLPRVPDRILTDNGPEFSNRIFNDALREHNIEHTFSTPYTPTSNGAVERINKTVIELLKGIADNHSHWDEQLSKVILTYNHSYHSQISTTPSKCILNQAYTSSDNLPLDRDTLDTWRQGHPNFSSFKINQKVIKKINRIGNRVQYKLKQKFEGPFYIKKVQSNRVTYEICDINNHESVIKVHHKQLRAYKEMPYYIKRYLHNEREIDTDATNLNNNNNVKKTSHVFICSDSESSDEDSESSNGSSENSSFNNSDESVSAQTWDLTKIYLYIKHMKLVIELQLQRSSFLNIRFTN